MITIEKGIEIARIVETVVSAVGYHCGLGGSLLHKGQSEKDIDIFIYPHNGYELRPDALRNALRLARFTCRGNNGNSEFQDSKVIESWDYVGGYRIDFIFLK